MSSEVLASLISAVVGGALVALINHLLIRRKTEAETKKIQAETNKIKLETEKTRNELEQLSSTVEEVMSRPISLGTSERQLYDGAIQALTELEPRFVKIYAPFGFWEQSDEKMKWFKKLTRYLMDHDGTEAHLIFGIPYWQSAYEYMKAKLLVNFARVGGVIIRYIPPVAYREVLPVMGMMVFDTQVVSVAFGIGEAHLKADTAWTIKDAEISSTADTWFNKIWSSHEDHELKRPKLSLEEGFKSFEDKYAGHLLGES